MTSSLDQDTLSDDSLFQGLLKILDDQTDNEHAVAGTTGPDRAKSLATEIEASILAPDEAVQHDRAPLPFILGIKPPSGHRDQLLAFVTLIGMSAILRLFASNNMVQLRELRKADKPYSLSKPEEFNSALSEGVDATVKALTQNLGGYYTMFAEQTQTENELLKRSRIHDFVLSRIFRDIPNLGEYHIEQLDKLLTEYSQLLKPYEISEASRQDMLKFCIILQYVKLTDITGSGEIMVAEPCTRVVSINLKAEEWICALAKPNDSEKEKKKEKEIEKESQKVEDEKNDNKNGNDKKDGDKKDDDKKGDDKKGDDKKGDDKKGDDKKGDDKKGDDKKGDDKKGDDKKGGDKEEEEIRLCLTTTTIDSQLNTEKYQRMKDRCTTVLKKACRDLPELQNVLEKRGIEGFGLRTMIILNNPTPNDGDGKGPGGKEPGDKRPEDVKPPNKPDA